MDDPRTLDYLKRAVAGLREANQRLAGLEAAATEPIAIIGMACRYPGGVSTPEQLWDLVAAGRDAVTGFPADRGWDTDSIYGEHSSVRPAAGGFLDDVAGFDAEFFGIVPRQALIQDPRQRLLLEVTWEALERAGLVPLRLRGAMVGVFVGASGHDYLAELQQAPELTEGYLLAGDGTAWLSGRLAYFFGFHGPAVTLDTACSSSLVALHQACQSLRLGECTLALAGGASVMVSPLLFSESSIQRALASDGRCKAYAQAADGTGWGEGAGILLLERLSDAEKNGHRILAVVRGSAINSDGASGRMTAPHGPSQEQVIRQALAAARLTPDDIDTVEGHGTGTALGDPIEVGALNGTYGVERDPRWPLWLGSVKSNLAHTQAASGVAGVIKMVEAIEHGVLPPTLGVDQPSDHVDWSAGTVRLLTEPLDWPQRDRPRRAGVSSFGGSGTNAHVIIEQPPVRLPSSDPRPQPGHPTRFPGPAPYLVSARSAAALRAQAASLRGHVHDLGHASVGWSLATSRSVFDHRAAIIAGDQTALETGLDAIASGIPAAGLITGARRADAGQVAFVFPGQGWQWTGMGLALLDSAPGFAAQLAQCDEALRPWTGWSVTDVLRQMPGAPELDRLDVVQPVLFAVMTALAELWREYGVQPAAVIGHSQGEVAAAYAAGALSLADAAKIVARRSQVMAAAAGGGAMMAIAASAADVSQRIERFGGSVSIAVRNGPAAVTVGGGTGPIDELEAELRAAGIKVRRIKGATGAGHTAEVEIIRDELLAALGQITPRPSRIPFYSTVTGDVLDTSELDAGYWYSNARRPVLFDPAVRRLLKDGYAAFAEASAHPVLAGAVQDIADDAGLEVVTTGTLRRDDGGLDRFLASAAELWTRGVDVDWTPAFAGQPQVQVDLPTYPFQRRRYWLSGAGRPQPAAGARPDLLPDLPAEAAGPALAIGADFSLLTPADQDKILLGVVRSEAAALAGFGSAEDIEPTAHFLELGFDSLMVAQFRNRLSAATGLPLPGGLALECPSPVALAKRLRELLTATALPQARPPADSLVRLYLRACDAGVATQAMEMLEQAATLVPGFDRADQADPHPAPIRMAEGADQPVLVCLTPYLVAVGAHQFARFAAQFRGQRAVWVLMHPGFAAGEPIPSSMDALMALHAEVALEVAAGAPIVLVGYSVGGWAACGVAAQLERAGSPAARVIMIDTFSWDARHKSAIFDTWQKSYARAGVSPALTADELIAAGRYKRLFDDWEPPDFGAPTLLIQASETSLLDPIGGSAAVGTPAQATAAVTVPGDHFSMMTDQAASTAEAVRRWLAASEGGNHD